MPVRLYYVYMMQSPSRTALYVGMCSELRRRVWQHKEHFFEGFTAAYNCSRLVWFERYTDVHRAIARERQIKRWRREKKETLIHTANPHWTDLAEDWFHTKGPSAPALRASARDDT